MEEFNKIKWTRENLADDPTTFVGDEDVLNDDDVKTSYTYKFLNKKFNLIKSEIIKHEPTTRISIPGDKYNLRENLTSNFTHDQHSKLLNGLKNILLNKPKVDFYENQNIEFYNSYKPQIAIENAQFLQCAEQVWNGKDGKRVLNIKNHLKNYMVYEWQKKVKCLLDYPALYKQSDLLSYSYLEDECSIQMIQTQNILEVGTVAKFIPHALTSSCILKINTLPTIDKKVNYYSNLSVSKDKNIDTIIQNNNIDIVISLSGLKKLVNFTDINNTWTIPVVVKVIEVKQQNGTTITKTVVYIEKPLPKAKPTIVDYKERYSKLLLRSNFCNQEGFTYPNKEIDNENLNLKQNIDNSITEEPVDENMASINHKIHHNVSYRHWKLGQIDEHNQFVKIPGSNRIVNVLVRSKIDACEIIESGQLQSLSVVPKLEYQLNYGASVYTKSELSHLWTTLFFKPFSSLYRIRMEHYSSEVVMIEPCNMQKVNNEASYLYNYKPVLGLGVLYKIFYNLKNLSEGNYLLRHQPKHGPFVALLQETDCKDGFNLHQEYENVSTCSEMVIKPWIPIDPNIILPNHIHIGQMPGMFRPKPFSKATSKGFKRKKKKTRAARKKKS